MRILVAHNRYQHRGGEDLVVASETALLRNSGHFVEYIEVDNDHITGFSSAARASFTSFYSVRNRNRVEALIGKMQPDLVHVHNFFPTLSPSIFHACSDRKIPVVHTLHNYRLVCAGATLFRAGAVCEECIEKQSILPGIRHACYRDSHVGTAVVGLNMAIHASLGLWSKHVAAFIALTEFAADKIGGSRVPRSKIFVKPNSVEDAGLGSADGDYALYVGRLTHEKGIGTILSADATGILPRNVLIIGDGPLAPDVKQTARRPGSKLTYLGYLDHKATLEYMRHAKVLLMPSVWYEGGLPLVVIEAFSLGLPVIGADVGNVGCAIQHGVTGLLYPPGDAGKLCETLTEYFTGCQPTQMREAAREHYLANHTPSENYRRLMKIYQAASRASGKLLPD